VSTSNKIKRVCFHGPITLVVWEGKRTLTLRNAQHENLLTEQET
jgi:hypothetical protein